MSGLAWGQCFVLNGKIINAANNDALSATFSVKKDNRKISIGKSAENGLFSVKIPCNSISVIIEKPGFRPINIPVSGNEGTYLIDLGLFPVDKQTTNQPYFQSEQKDIVLNNSDSVKSGKRATRYFKLIDVQSKAVISGNVCLYYTQKSGTNCFASAPGSKESTIIFDQEDIIGIVANATGYQPYNGNLIIDKIDNSSQIYEIALSKIISYIAYSIDPGKFRTPVKAEIVSKNRSKIPVKVKDGFHGFAAVSTGGNYVLRVDQGLKKKPVELVLPNITGLFLAKISLPSDSIAGQLKDLNPATTSTKQSDYQYLNPIKSKVIYFRQSSYELSQATKQSLDSVARWLTQNPSSFAQITGYTDNIGNALRNVTLSEYRAKVTTNYLVNQGVLVQQLQWEGLGGEFPTSSNDQEATKALNRRVEIKINNEVSSQTKK